MAEWKRLECGIHEVCASTSHDHDVGAAWCTDAGGVGTYYGTYYCDACRLKIDQEYRREEELNSTSPN